jgi:acetate kinase
LAGHRIVAAGHRVVHRGMQFTQPVLLDTNTRSSHDGNSSGRLPCGC